MEDKEIVSLFLKRNEAAVSETQKKYAAYCFSIANNILHSPSIAEESVNDTWLAAWNSIPPNEPQDLAAYLGKTARYIALKQYRTINTQKRGCGETSVVLDELEGCIPARDDVERTMILSELTEILNDFLGKISVSDRRVFIRRYWYFESIKDIAAFYGFSESKVKMMLKRTRDKLKDKLDKEGYTI